MSAAPAAAPIPGAAPLASTTYGDAGPHVVLLHGLFGQGRNFTGVAKALAAGARVTLLDLPDHGRSPWTDDVSYLGVADRVAAQLRTEAPGEAWTVVGHSMGGKVAMLVALRHPDLVDRLCVVDIAPGTSSAVSGFGTYVEAMRAVDLAALPDRATADRVVAERVPDRTIRGFLLQNLRRDGTGEQARWRWQMNLDLLGDRLPDLAGWPEGDLGTYGGPVLWLAGNDSPYVTPEAAPAMRALFPRVRLVRIKGAGHWVHADQPEVFVATLRGFLAAT
ncbi:alpha/beta fold hydrolase [Microlunatus flavus]|uniref:Pimeloyl-ACP methyl ester carboxylesterase n=1 Tax=Microlunatus flavus TaxID=1036181 RepID=A0A1H9F383_9ACTN|nr:alpha/beta fold hydrolase [Microlunatus flavus]SEQ32347.1 Pimeloyl-ACP methyl ester carboxylesterase [Microlunatus flavus]